MCDVTGALALLGLYLRGQDDYRIWFDPDGQFTFRLGKEMFFWVAARGLLPEGWRWVAACSQHADGTGDDTLRYLALSTLERMVQVLKNRDLVYRALNQPQNGGRAGTEPARRLRTPPAGPAVVGLASVPACTVPATSAGRIGRQAAQCLHGWS